MKDEKKKLLLTTMGSGIAFGMLAHLFGMVNMLQSSDSITAVWGTGAGLSSGRWTLEIINNFLSKYWPIWNLGFYNNLLAIIFIALSSYLIVDMFKIKDKWLCAALSGIMVTFPAVNATFLYTFASVYYAAAVFMTVSGVWLTEKYKFGFIPAIILSAIALGIYQAYFPFMIVLFLTLLIVHALDGKAEGWNLLKRAFFYLAVLLLSLLAYFAVLKIMLAVTNTELSGYQNINNMGKLSLREIPYRIIATYKDFLRIMLDPANHTTGTAFVAAALNLLEIFGLAAIAYIAIKNWKKISVQNKVLLALFLIIYPLGLYSIKIMCFDSEIHEVMLYSLALLYLLPVIMCCKLKEHMNTDKQKKSYKVIRICVAVLLCLVCLNYSMQSNAVYSKVYFDRIQAQTYWTGLLARAEGTEGYSSDMEWAFIGMSNDNLLHNEWDSVPYKNIGTAGYQVTRYEYYLPIQLGYDVRFADEAVNAELAESEAVQNMNCYPDAGSIAVIDGVLVVKFS